MRARGELELPADGALVACVRGFDPVYNPELVIDAFALLRRRRDDVRLVLTGGAAASVPARVTEAIARHRIDHSVVLLRRLPPARIVDVYRAADVVVSVPSSDSSPRSVWEALACGRPVVVSDLPWARDEIEDGRHALLTPCDPAAVAAALERALEDPTLGREGRGLASERLDPAACSARIDSLYRSVARQP